MKKHLFFLYFIMLSQVFLKAQFIDEGMYIRSNSQDFFYIKNNSVQFRIHALGGFRCYLLGKGKYKIGKKGLFVFIPDSNMLMDFFEIDKQKINDSLIEIKVIAFDTIPLKYALIKLIELKSKNKNTIYIGKTDSNGVFIFNNKQVSKYADKEIFIDIGEFGYEAKRKITLEKGYKYIIKPKISEYFSCFHILLENNYFLIQPINDKEVEIIRLGKKKRKRKNYVKTKFFKVNTIIPYDELLFDKNVEYFLEKSNGK